MKNDFEAFVTGVRRGTASWAENIDILKSDVPSEYLEIFNEGVNLAEAMHWVSTAENPEQLTEDQDLYDSIAYVINGYFGSIVVESIKDNPLETIGFINPETGEKVNFHA